MRSFLLTSSTDQFELSPQLKKCWLQDRESGDEVAGFTFADRLEVTNFLRKLVNSPKTKVVDLYNTRITNTTVETMMNFNNQRITPGMWLADGTRLESEAKEMGIRLDNSEDSCVFKFVGGEVLLELSGIVTLCPEEPMFVVYQ